MHIFVLLALALLTGCTDAAYHQPVYIISDSTQEEEVEYVAPEPDINNER